MNAINYLKQTTSRNFLSKIPSSNIEMEIKMNQYQYYLLLMNG